MTQVKAKYRYRSPLCASHKTKWFVERNLEKIGQVTRITGYRYERWNAQRDENNAIVGSYRTVHEAVIVTGVRGTARFSGVCWGYGGSGPHALLDMLLAAGVEKNIAENVAFRTHRREQEELGWDWQIRREDSGMFHVAIRI